jgi:hypothetical protein
MRNLVGVTWIAVLVLAQVHSIPLVYATVDFSPNGAMISASGPSPVAEITDASTAKWTLTGSVVFRNGVKTISSGVANIFYINGRIYQENQSGSFWYWNTVVSGWVGASKPWVQSANNTVITATNEGSALIVDAAKPTPHFYGLSKGVVYVDGAPAGYTAGVVSLTYTDGVVYQKNSAGLIFSWNGSKWVAANSGASAIPTLVKQAGYTNNVFLDDFDSLNTIDINSTSAPGYNWYLGNNPGSALSLKNVNGMSVLRIDRSGGAIIGATRVGSDVMGKSFGVYHGGGAYFEANMAYGQTGARSVPIKSVTKGTTTLVTLMDTSICHPFAPLFCPSNGANDAYAYIKNYEVTGAQGMTQLNGSFPASIVVGGVSGSWTVTLNVDSTSWSDYTGGGTLYNKSSGWPAFWANPTKHLVQQAMPWAGEASPNDHDEHYEEFDFMEYFVGASSMYNSTLIDWWGEYGGKTPACPTGGYCRQVESQGIASVNGTPLASTESDPIFHKYGALWIPSVKDSTGAYSQGSVQWFLDGEPVGTQITWVGAPPSTGQTPVKPWVNSVLDQEDLSITFDTEGGPFMYIDYAAVWQLP